MQCVLTKKGTYSAIQPERRIPKMSEMASHGMAALLRAKASTLDFCSSETELPEHSRLVQTLFWVEYSQCPPNSFLHPFPLTVFGPYLLSFPNHPGMGHSLLSYDHSLFEGGMRGFNLPVLKLFTPKCLCVIKNPRINLSLRTWQRVDRECHLPRECFQDCVVNNSQKIREEKCCLCVCGFKTDSFFLCIQ